MMRELDTYFGLCPQVYDLSKPKPPEEELKVLNAIFSKLQAGCEKILGCWNDR